MPHLMDNGSSICCIEYLDDVISFTNDIAAVVRRVVCVVYLAFMLAFILAAFFCVNTFRPVVVTYLEAAFCKVFVW